MGFPEIERKQEDNTDTEGGCQNTQRVDIRPLTQKCRIERIKGNCQQHNQIAPDKLQVHQPLNVAADYNITRTEYAEGNGK